MFADSTESGVVTDTCVITERSQPNWTSIHRHCCCGPMECSLDGDMHIQHVATRNINNVISVTGCVVVAIA